MAQAPITHDEALHQAIGWLVGALQSEHPGFLASEAASARSGGHDQVADVLLGWLSPAARMAALGDLLASTMPDPDDEDRCEDGLREHR